MRGHKQQIDDKEIGAAAAVIKEAGATSCRAPWLSVYKHKRRVPATTRRFCFL